MIEPTWSRRALLLLAVGLAACGKEPTGGEARPATGERRAGPTTVAPIAPAAGPGHEVAILAGGCFWGMEDLLRKIDGVVDTEVGYIGGDPARATYDQVHLGDTGHAESVKVEFDPRKLSYAVLLERWYFRMHDPTTVDRQGNDRGSQYRSTIFYTSDAQRTTALAVRAQVEASHFWPAPIVTTVEPAGVFTVAEAEH